MLDAQATPMFTDSAAGTRLTLDFLHLDTFVQGSIEEIFLSHPEIWFPLASCMKL